MSLTNSLADLRSEFEATKGIRISGGEDEQDQLCVMQPKRVASNSLLGGIFLFLILQLAIAQRSDTYLLLSQFEYYRSRRKSFGNKLLNDHMMRHTQKLQQMMKFIALMNEFTASYETLLQTYITLHAPASKFCVNLPEKQHPTTRSLLAPLCGTDRPRRGNQLESHQVSIELSTGSNDQAFEGLS